MSFATTPGSTERASGSRLLSLGRSLNNWGARTVPEEKFSWKHLESSAKVLDVACGIGNFISVHPDRTVGIDINEESVKHCRALGYDARLGNALDLPFDDHAFDGVHSAHVMHAFGSQQAIRYLSELMRVVRPGGTIVVSNLCSPESIFNYPEVSRPYPPEAVFRMIHASTSPKSKVGTEIPGAKFRAIHFRRPPLLQFRFVGSERMWHAATVLNSLQYGCFLRKFWAFEGYTIVLTKN